MAEEKKQKRVYTGYYKRYDGKKVYVVRAVKDADTGEAIIICKECAYSDLKKEIYYTITKSSFCGSIEKNGTLIPKYIRMTNIPITEGEINECIEDRFPGPKRKDFTYKDDEYQTRFIRFSATYKEYAKDLCVNYVIDLRRAKLTREAKRYIGVSGKQDYLAMCEDLKFLQSSMKTVLADYNDLFRKRFVERLSIRKYAAEAGVNRGVIERTQNAFYHQLAGLLYERDQADGIIRIKKETSVPISDPSETETTE